MNQNGQATVEFALVALLLFTLLFAIIDLAIMFYVNLTMQRAVREGARHAITGQQTGSAGRTELIRTIREASVGLYDKNAYERKEDEPKVSVLKPAETKNFSNYTGYQGTPLGNSTGEPNEIIIVSLTYSWPLLTPIVRPFFENGTYTFQARATMRNEPWGDR